MKAGLALVQRLGFSSQKSPANDHAEDHYDLRLKRLVRLVETTQAPKGSVFKRSH
jgi:hypothetical protein